VPTLFIVGGGLFGSQAAAWARRQGIEAVVFDAGCSGAASPAAAGLFREQWLPRKRREHYHRGRPVLEELYGVRSVSLMADDGTEEHFLHVPPSVILEPAPVPQRVTAVGDGWLEAAGQRYEGWIYVAAGVWCAGLVPGVQVQGKAGAAFRFAGERPGRIRPLGWGRQAIAFVRDPGTTHFSDGTAETDYHAEHDRQTLLRAAEMGLTEEPLRRYWGWRPYTSGGLLFRRLGSRTWVATGGRKMGTLLGASCARLLVEQLRT
jgi:glycine/D-amino acid oxidase-like deaminating enzyme